MKLLTIAIWGAILYICISGISGQATDECLNCLSKNRPVDGCITIPHETKFCGRLRLSPGFFGDCRGVSQYPLKSKDFETCAQDFECAKQCVRAFQYKYQDDCLLARQSVLQDENIQSLSCADYGRMHFRGQGGCGQVDSPDTLKYIANLTKFCGCSTVGDGCHKDTTPSGISDSTVSGTELIVYIIPTVCGVILIAVLTVCIGCYWSYKKDVTLAKLAAQQSVSFDPGNSALTLNKHTTGSLSSYDYQSKLGVIPQIDVENNTSSLTQPQPNIFDPGSPGLPPRIRYSNAPTKASATPSSWLNNSIEPPVRCSDNKDGYSVSIPVKLRQDVSRKEEIGTFTTEHDNVIKSNANPDISTCETIPDQQQVHNDRDDDAISDDEKVELYFSPSPPALCGNHYQNALGTAFTSTAQEASPKKHSAPLPAPRRGNTPPSNNSGQNHYQNHDFS